MESPSELACDFESVEDCCWINEHSERSSPKWALVENSPDGDVFEYYFATEDIPGNETVVRRYMETDHPWSAAASPMSSWHAAHG